MKIEREILAILRPLLSVDGFIRVLTEMGAIPPDPVDLIPQELTGLVAQSQSMLAEIAQLTAALTDGDDSDALENAIRVFVLAREVFTMIEDIRAVPDTLDLTTVVAPYDEPQFWTDLARQLPGYLLQNWVSLDYPLAYQVMQTLRLWKAPADGYGIDMVQVNRLLSEPGPALLALIQTRGEIDLSRVLLPIRSIVGLLDIIGPQERTMIIDGQSYVDTSYPAPRPLVGFRLLPPGLDDVGDVSVQMDFEDGDILAQATISGETTASLEIAEDWLLSAQLSGDAGLSFRFSRDDGVSVDPARPSANASVELRGAPTDPWLLLGFGNGPKLTLDAMSLTVDAAVTGSAPELCVGLGFEDLRLSINLGESDSFVAEALPLDALELAFSADLTWSSVSGINLQAAGPSELSIPLNLTLGPITVPHLTIGVAPLEDRIELEFTISAGANLGFMQAVVEGIGVRSTLASVSNGTGALGDMDLDVAFKPPSGLGLAIGNPDGPIGGGGYLYVDRDAGRYEGILHLKIVKIGITAVVIIDTQALESGAWSMFFALFIELPSIQLGFGISLDGVGGVAGIHRSLDPDALLAAVRSGAMDTVLFPENPIADAPVVIDTFRNLFPPAQGRYVFGPVVKLGWAKGVVSAELGTVIELPDPILVAILGSISIALPRLPAPSEDAPPDDDIPRSIIALRLDVAGVFDFEAGTIAIDAFLHDSSIAGFPIEGGMALRAGFKNNPMFILAVGGFHPGFPQPENFPIIPRLAMRIEIASVIEISCEAYFAVASNTVQFGAAIRLLADIEIFRIEGEFEFDALFEFNPFRVDFDLNMFVSVQAVGVDLLSIRLAGTADGPKPWEITAIAEVNIIGYRDGIEINERNGPDEQEPALPPADVFDLMIAALEHPDAWEVVSPAASPVLLAEAGDLSPGIAPDGRLTISQSVAPLDTLVDRHGTNPQVVHNKFLLDLQAGPDALTGTVTDWFAPGHFRDLGQTDQAQLSAPSFEQMPAGRSLEGNFRMPGTRTASTQHKVSRRDPDLALDPAELAAALEASLEDLVGTDGALSAPTSGLAVLEVVADMEPVIVNQPQFTAVSVTTGVQGTAAAGNYMAATETGDLIGTAIVRAHELEGMT